MKMLGKIGPYQTEKRFDEIYNYGKYNVTLRITQINSTNCKSHSNYIIRHVKLYIWKYCPEHS